jgi:hypothetical protein
MDVVLLGSVAIATLLWGMRATVAIVTLLWGIGTRRARRSEDQEIVARLGRVARERAQAGGCGGACRTGRRRPASRASLGAGERAIRRLPNAAVAVIGVAVLYLMGALASSPSADPAVRFLAGVA